MYVILGYPFTLFGDFEMYEILVASVGILLKTDDRNEAVECYSGARHTWQDENVILRDVNGLTLLEHKGN